MLSIISYNWGWAPITGGAQCYGSLFKKTKNKDQEQRPIGTAGPFPLLFKVLELFSKES